MGGLLLEEGCWGSAWLLWVRACSVAGALGLGCKGFVSREALGETCLADTGGGAGTRAFVATGGAALLGASWPGLRRAAKFSCELECLPCSFPEVVRLPPAPPTSQDALRLTPWAAATTLGGLSLGTITAPTAAAEDLPPPSCFNPPGLRGLEWWRCWAAFSASSGACSCC